MCIVSQASYQEGELCIITTDLLNCKAGLDKQGNLRISRHGICSTQEETHEDIVSMGLNLGLPQMFGVSAMREHFSLVRQYGVAMIPLETSCVVYFPGTPESCSSV
eukprot:gb/GECG01010341.1/.p1 GENE.gb/GECG01010341.1/~~gb/GECG01010341.1/.p1  ORF type:complete len:106 (+),score=3.57 gb/GECG01010341.1/:1-318(+)